MALAALVAFSAISCANPAIYDQVGQTSETTHAEQVYAEYAKLSGEQRHEALVRAAQAEGKLTIYTCSSDTVNLVAPAFAKKYNLDVDALSTGVDEELRRRITQEDLAGDVKADVIESLGPDMSLFASRRLFAPYESDIKERMSTNMRDYGWTPTYNSVQQVAWNTELISDEQKPKTLADLADPRYAGQVTLVNGSGIWYATVYEYYRERGMSDEDFTSMMRKIAANSQGRDGNSSSTALMAGGVFGVLVQTQQFDVLQFREDGAPIAADPTVPPVVITPAGAGLTRHAAHPAAALLFLDFYLTEGQQIVSDVFRAPVNPAENVPWRLDNTDAAAQTPLEELSDPERLNEWNIAFDNLVRNTSGYILPPGV